MYKIYKYEWTRTNRLGSVGAEIIVPCKRGYMCYFDTKEGPDMRLLNSKNVAEYMPPDAQEYAHVYKSNIPFYGLGQLRKTLSRAIYVAAFRRLVGRPKVSRTVRDLAAAYTWESTSPYVNTLD